MAELLFATATASTAGATAAAKRQGGRGRRPSARQVNALLKRQALHLGSLDRMLPGGVAGLLGGAGGPPSLDDLAAEVRARHAPAGAADA